MIYSLWFGLKQEHRAEMDVCASALHPAPSSPSSPQAWLDHQAGRQDLISRCTSRNMACHVGELLIRSLLLQFLEGISITPALLSTSMSCRMLAPSLEVFNATLDRARSILVQSKVIHEF